MPIEYPIDFIHQDGAIFRVESPADAAPYKSSVSPRHVEVTRVWDGERAAIFIAKHDWIVRDALGRPVGREDIPSQPTRVSRHDRQRQAAQRAAALKLPIPRTGKNKIKRKGILLWINGSPFAMGKNLQRLQHAANRMNDTGLPLCYVNLVGGQDELVFDGHSFACDGGTFVETGIFKTGMQIVSMTAGPDRPRIGLPALQPWVNQPTGIGEAYQAKVLGVRDYLQKQGFASVVIGMSGGIDSAAVASICVDAIGPENVHLVRLPSRFSSGGSLADAEKARALLGCPMRTIEIEPMVAAIRAAYSGARWDISAAPNPAPDQLTGIADENIQARARGLILMAISNQEGHMLLTTGNKSEVAVGYSTLYGDMCGG